MGYGYNSEPRREVMLRFCRRKCFLRQAAHCMCAAFSLQGKGIFLTCGFGECKI